jgi:hypothetical protein
MEEIGIFLDQFHRFQLFHYRLFGNFVFCLPAFFLEMTGIGDITNIPDLVPEMQEIPVDKIESDKGPGMSQMAFPADGRSAYIHAYMTGGNGGKRLFLSSIRIVDF